MRAWLTTLSVIGALALPAVIAQAETSFWDEAFPHHSDLSVSVGQPIGGAAELLGSVGIGTIARENYASLKTLLDAEIQRLAREAVNARGIAVANRAAQATAMAEEARRIQTGINLSSHERAALAKIARGRVAVQAEAGVAAWLGLRALIRIPLAMGSRNPGFMPEVNMLGMAAKSGGRAFHHVQGNLTPAARAAQ